MPPKVKIPKEEIIRAAFEITKESGIEAVTAKAIALRLNCSIQPVYWVFDTMDNLRIEVVREAVGEYNKFILTEIEGINEYMAIGWNYVRFAKEQPNLFKLLYMTDRQKNINIAVSDIDENKAHIVSLIRKLYGLDETLANKLYVRMWVFSHGIATLIATQTVNLSNADIAEMLADVGRAIVKELKAIPMK